MSAAGAFPDATDVSGKLAGAPCAGASVPKENIPICDGVPVSVFTKVRAAFFMLAISVALMDDDTSKTIPTFRPHAGLNGGLFSPLAKAALRYLRSRGPAEEEPVCLIVLDCERTKYGALVVLSLVWLDVPVLIVSMRK